MKLPCPRFGHLRIAGAGVSGFGADVASIGRKGKRAACRAPNVRHEANIGSKRERVTAVTSAGVLSP